MSSIKHKGILVILGEKYLVIPPVTREEQEKLKVGSNNFSHDLNSISLTAVIDAIHTAVVRNYPDIPRAWIAENIDFTNVVELMEAVADVSGRIRNEITAKLCRLDS